MIINLLFLQLFWFFFLISLILFWYLFLNFSIINLWIFCTFWFSKLLIRLNNLVLTFSIFWLSVWLWLETKTFYILILAFIISRTIIHPRIMVLLSKSIRWWIDFRYFGFHFIFIFLIIDRRMGFSRFLILLLIKTLIMKFNVILFLSFHSFIFHLFGRIDWRLSFLLIYYLLC